MTSPVRRTTCRRSTPGSAWYCVADRLRQGSGCLKTAGERNLEPLSVALTLNRKKKPGRQGTENTRHKSSPCRSKAQYTEAPIMGPHQPSTSPTAALLWPAPDSSAHSETRRSRDTLRRFARRISPRSSSFGCSTAKPRPSGRKRAKGNCVKSRITKQHKVLLQANCLAINQLDGGEAVGRYIQNNGNLPAQAALTLRLT